MPPPKAPARTRMSADARREQITQAARRVFVRSGLAGARTKDIAAEAGVNEALLYRHFASKEELFEAAVAGPLERAVATLVEFSGEPPEAFDVSGDVMVERTRAFIADLLEVMDEVAPLLGVMLFGDAGTAATYYRDRIAPSLRLVEDVIETNLAHWSHHDFDVEICVQLVFGTAWFASLSDRLTGRTRDHDELADQIARMLLRGLIRPDARDGLD